MPCRLRREEVVAIQVLAKKGVANTEIGRKLGVSEGDVRYHIKRKGAPDGRKDKHFLAEKFAEKIKHWVESMTRKDRPANVLDLFEHLVQEHDYPWSYKSVLRFVRARYPKPRIRTYRRVETPPGAQTQTDWAEYPSVDVGEGPEPLHAFVMVLSHSRKHAVVWSRSEDQLGWLRCHNEAYRRLRGVAAVNRIDNVKTAIVRGAGAWGVINDTYRAYARAVGFHVDACPPGQGNTKGKVEAKVRLGRLRLDPSRERFSSLAELQARTDEQTEAWARRAICPVTGLSVRETWERELEQLAELPILPEPFDVAVTREASRDCLVHFENHQYTVPFAYAGQPVEVHGCADRVQIWADGAVLREYPRHTLERILIDPSCYEGESTDRVLAPPPLGRMGQRLQEILQTPVERRPIDLYAALMEVAR
jgi:transposase